MPSIRLMYTTPIEGTTKHGMVLDGPVSIDPTTGTASGQYRNLVTDPHTPGYETPSPENELTSFRILLTDTDLQGILAIVAGRALQTGGLAPIASSAVEATAPSSPPPPVSIEIAPVAHLTPGASIQLTARVSGAVNQDVTWQVLDTAGGSVTTDGIYTAPAAPGFYRVGVVSQADPSKGTIAVVTVEAAE